MSELRIGEKVIKICVWLCGCVWDSHDQWSGTFDSFNDGQAMNQLIS